MGRDLIQKLLLEKENEQIKEVFLQLERLMQLLFEQKYFINILHL